MKPSIAVAGRLGAAGRVSRDSVVFAGKRCLDAVLRAGGEPLLLAPQALADPDAIALLERFDGLLLMGGGDVAAAAYGEAPHPQSYGVNDAQDEFEMVLAKAALAIELPLLALCRGMQVVNVVAGGTLHQHLGDLDGLIDHGPPRGGPPTDGVLHPIAIAPASRMADALGGDVVITGNSYHHQAVATVGDGFTVTATTSDGVVEAIEATEGWAVCVQWHPEDTAMHDAAQQRLFDALVSEAAARQLRAATIAAR